MQINLVLELPSSGGYEIIVTAMDVVSSYLFAYRTSNQHAKTVAKFIIIVMAEHAYLPATVISDKESAFESKVIKEVTDVLGITLKYANSKHAQTIGMLNRSDASLKQVLKNEPDER